VDVDVEIDSTFSSLVTIILLLLVVGTLISVGIPDTVSLIGSAGKVNGLIDESIVDCNIGEVNDVGMSGLDNIDTDAAAAFAAATLAAVIALNTGALDVELTSFEFSVVVLSVLFLFSFNIDGMRLGEINAE
jgi:hypothetical protein